MMLKINQLSVIAIIISQYHGAIKQFLGGGGGGGGAKCSYIVLFHIPFLFVDSMTSVFD